MTNTGKWIIFSGSVLLVGLALYHKRKSIINYAFSREQEMFLQDLNPDAIEIFKKFIAEVESKLPYKALLTSGYRSFPKQAELHKENPDNAIAGKSMHNYGAALDLNLISKKDGSRIVKSSPRTIWEKTGILEIAKKYGLKWGGDIAGYYDPVHFEVPYGGDKLYAKAIKQFGKEDKIIGNRLKLVA